MSWYTDSSSTGVPWGSELVVVGEVLAQRAAQGDVEHLVAAADRQRGQAPVDGAAHERRTRVSSRVPLDAVEPRVRRLPVARRVDVAAAHEQQPVEAGEQLVGRHVLAGRHEQGTCAGPSQGEHVGLGDTEPARRQPRTRPDARWAATIAMSGAGTAAGYKRRRSGNSVPDVPDELTPYEAVNQFFDEAADLVHLKDEFYDVLKTSYREIAVQVPVRMDDGDAAGCSGATACSTTARAGRTRAASATTRPPTSTRSAPWRR